MKLQMYKVAWLPGADSKGGLEMKEISTKEAADLLERESNISIIDVREEEEVAAGKIPEAVHIPLGELPDRITEFNKDNEYIMVCRSGARSSNATLFLDSLGYKATNMVGGMLQWQGEVN